MGVTVEISSELLQRIKDAGANSPGEEICGLLLGDTDRVSAILPCRNVAAAPARRFEIDPAALLAAHRAARGGGGRPIGHYHSHPNGVALPSACDAHDAAPDGSLWLIVAGGLVRGWRAVADGAIHGRFDPVAISCAAESASPERRQLPGDEQCQ